MKLGAEDKKKLIAAGTFGVLAVGYLIYTLVGSGGSSDTTQNETPAPASVSRPAAPSAPSAATPRAAVSRMDPTLHPEGMLLTESLVYSGSGRNIFLPPGAEPTVAVAKIPTPVATGRYVPPTPVNMGPPPPPPIDLRFFGTSTRRDGQRQAFLLRGDDVFVASTGDIVSRRYRVGAITLTGVEITDLTTNNTQRLPMSTQ